MGRYLPYLLHFTDYRTDGPQVKKRSVDNTAGKQSSELLTKILPPCKYMLLSAEQAVIVQSAKDQKMDRVYNIGSFAMHFSLILLSLVILYQNTFSPALAVETLLPIASLIG